MLKYHGNTRIESLLKWIEKVICVDLPQFQERLKPHAAWSCKSCPGHGATGTEDIMANR